MTPLRIGLFGYGVVGSGFDRLVGKRTDAVIRKVAVKHPFLHPEIESARLVHNMFDILHDDDIDVVVEAIDDADAAFDILKQALQHGKPVVSANKKMIAEHLPEIIRLQKRFHTPVLYEAACCAGIPVVRTLEDYFPAELTRSFKGIINGSTNYMLTAMERYRFRFDHALQLAQEAGFAERDASLDVEGKDAAYKLSIIIRHLWGKYLAPEQITHTGIQNILPQDLRLAERLNGLVKLIARTERLEDGDVSATILPTLLLKSDTLYNTAHEYNGVVLEDMDGNEQFLYGKGSGAGPTAYGLWADVKAVQRKYAYRYTQVAVPAQATVAEKEISVHLSIPIGMVLPDAFGALLKEYTADSRYCYFAGRVKLSLLAGSKWWKQEGISIIDISALDAGTDDELMEKLEMYVALQSDIFQPV